MTWSAMLRLAAVRFGLAPEAFWRLSLKEWRALTTDGGGDGLERAAFERLAAAWPDAAGPDQAGAGR